MIVSFLIQIFLLIVPIQDIETIRRGYIEAAQDDSKIAAFNELLANVSMEDSLVIVAYKGAALALTAKIEVGIKNKTAAFKKGVEYLEYAIKSDPENIELRFVRLSVQENSPRIVNYKDSIEEDKAFIFEHFQHILSTSLKEYIGDFILQSKAFSSEEKESLKL